MHTVIISDVLDVARAIATVAEDDREAALAQIIRWADMAHEYQDKHGQCHAGFGNGTLSGAAYKIHGITPNRSASDPAYLRSLALVCQTLAARLEIEAVPVAA